MPRLKRLELHGYKTFASKTEFEFPEISLRLLGLMVLVNPISQMPFVGFWVSRLTVF